MTIKTKLNIGITILLTIFYSMGVVIYFKLSDRMLGPAEIVITILAITGILDVFVFNAAINRSITRPIIELKNAMFSVGEGHFETQIKIESQDEIGQLASCFNNTVQRLRQTTTSVENLNTEISKRKDAQEALQKAHNELEQRVEQRTNELAVANDVLKSKNEQYIKAAHALKESETRLSTVLNSILAGVVVIEARTKKIVDVNPLAAELIGLPKEKIIGKMCHQFICSTNAGYCPISDMKQTVDKSERVLVKANGESVAIYKTVVPVIWDEKEYLVESFVDISDRKKAQEELEKLNHELDLAVRDLSHSNQELQEFAYIVAHDLKAPLRGIVTLANWITTDYAEKLGQDGKEQLDMLISKAKQTSNMINDILEYSKAGRKQQDMKEVDLNILLKEMIDGLDKGENNEVTFDDNFPTVICDKTQIFQVFQNLLTNAIKYMDKSEGKIHVGCSEDQQGSWLFSVSDNGPGIDKIYFEKIFKIFQTVSPKERADSTGIGLSIVKKIVELNGGKVWLESEVGKGTTFFFTFPKSKSPVTCGV
jgi:two-component system sensor kinase FixL